MNPTRSVLFLLLVVTVILMATRADADLTFGEPVSVRSTIPVLISYQDEVYCFSYDDLEMYFGSPRPGGQGDMDLWVSKRASREEDWGPPENLGPTVNSPQGDYYASISTDGLSLYFASWREGTATSWMANDDLYVTTRATRNDPWGRAVNLGSTINRSGVQERSPWISPDGLELYFMSARSGQYGGTDFWVTRRTTEKDPWQTPVNLGPPVNTAYYESYLSLSPDGLLLLFNESFTADRPRRPGGQGGSDMWIARRANLSAPWQAPANLGPKINSPSGDFLPRISPDGRTLYFLSDRTGWDCWQTSIDPNLDFDTDGNVDEKDLLVMTQHWGENYPRCDIGPFPWGDGVVDENDLKVLTEAVMTPGPKASDVPCDVVLSWISPAFANSCDVYLGTSFEAVNSADRANPQGVLVSQAQTTTAYDPAGLLELSRTYYWRTDFVVAGPTPTIYKGPVLEFTTAALTYRIKNITATASSAQVGSGPERTLDGSGLDKNDGHSTELMDMWWSMAEPSHWIQYEFDKVYTLHEMWVWNCNTVLDPFVGFGAKNVTIEYSTDGTAWTQLANVPEFARAPGKPGYMANTIVNFGGVPAQFVKLTIEKNWSSSAPQTGLSEVRFFCIQTAVAPKL